MENGGSLSAFYYPIVPPLLLHPSISTALLSPSGSFSRLPPLGFLSFDIGNNPDEDVADGVTNEGVPSSGTTPGLGSVPLELGPQSCNGAADPGSVDRWKALAEHKFAAAVDADIEPSPHSIC